MFWSLLALPMHFLCLFLLNFPSPLESHNYSPFLPARHFDERLLRDAPPATIKVVTKNGTKKLQQMQEGGKNVWRWVMEGARNPAPQATAPQTQARPAAAAPVAQAQARPAGPAPAAAAQPAGPIFVYDPPTPAEQRQLQDRLLTMQDIHLRVPKDVYSEYHKLVKDPEDSKKIIPSKTIPGKVVEIQRTSDNLYRALAYALTGTEMLHKATRMVVLEYFESFFGQWDKKQAQPWMDEYEVRSVRRQAEKIKAGKAGGTVELIAAAKKFNMNVLVYKTDKDMWLCMSPKTAHKWDLDKNCQSKDAMTIALELYDNENYDVIMDVQQKK
ncbi:hypothetical protein niasHS_014879 [Heterodera schachtii]|uniref:Uncharacterized protein n=1 Tax=Heterodera schachtii TaxID=97005 RepID=A0ABD2IKY6_HETSC